MHTYIILLQGVHCSPYAQKLNIIRLFGGKKVDKIWSLTSEDVGSFPKIVVDWEVVEGWLIKPKLY